MNVENLTDLPDEEFAKLKNEMVNHKTLGQVLSWAKTKKKSDFLPQIIAETITQDEYTIDVIISFRDLFLVFDTT